MQKMPQRIPMRSSASLLTSETSQSSRPIALRPETATLWRLNPSVPISCRVAKGSLDVVISDAWDPAKPQVKQFVADYTREMGQEPYSMHGYGYDGVMLALDAIRRAGSTDKEKIRQAMQATRGYKGVLGSIPAAYTFEEGRRTGFDPQGMVVRMYEGDKQGRVLHVGTK